MKPIYIIVFFVFLMGCSPKSEDAPSSASTPQPSEYEIKVEKAKAAVLNVLKDPSSAQFSDLREEGGYKICGYVNAKNGFGGYSGKKRFCWNPASGLGMGIEE